VQADGRDFQLAAQSTPKGAVQGTNDYPTLGYGGPQPPSGTHRYYFKIYALDQTLNLRAGAKRKELEKEMSGHVIAQGQLMGRYTRQK
jgi:Raf kinase inhibitor-like YbhB/YbcL family protein